MDPPSPHEGDRGGARSPLVPHAKLRPPAATGLRRGRLDRVLQAAWQHPLTLVWGPAGSGKTTLLAQFAAAVEDPIVWYRLDAEDTDPSVLLAHLGIAFASALDNGADGPGPRRTWSSLEEAVEELDRAALDRGLLLLDDLDAVYGTDSERLLDRLIDYAPRWLGLVAASRRLPQWNLSRRRVSGQLLEVSQEQLRFRASEVEQLYRDLYGVRLPPEDLAQLARQTEGWAAALQLFHLATRNQPPEDRQAMLAGLPTRLRSVREYLAQNVLRHLPAQLRNFLVETAVLGRLTETLCDQFLGRTGSLAVLEELEQRQIFILRLEDGASFRYHEILRRYLEGVLLDTVGEQGVRERFLRAGQLLEGEGYVGDALTAYCRCAHWEGARRLSHDAQPGDDAASEAAPASLVDSDPWVALNVARQRVLLGQWNGALGSYRRAEALFGGTSAAALCRREAVSLSAWTSRVALTGPDWTGRLRRALVADPSAAASTLPAQPTPGDLVAAACGSLLAGSAEEALALLARLAPEPRTGVGAAVVLLRAVAAAFLPGAPADPSLVERPAGLDPEATPWIARLGRAATALSATPAGIEDARAEAERLEADGDEWGSALAHYWLGRGLAGAGRPVGPHFLLARDRFLRLDAPVLALWAQAGHALSVDGPAARSAAEEVERLAHRLRVHAAAVVSAGRGSIPATRRPVPGAVPHAPERRVVVRCLGGFELSVDGRTLDVVELKPRARSVLRLLCAQADHGVHVETLLDALWPDLEPAPGKRSLQVAVSSVRRALLEVAGAGADAWLRRDGEAYRLLLPAGAEVDVVRFTQLAAHARTVDAPPQRRRESLQAAVAAYAGDLLPEEGPVDWVVERRRQLQAEATALSRALVAACLQLGDVPGAVDACERGLEIDRYDDALWRSLIAGREELGDPAGLARARAGYAHVLADLGIPGPSAPVAGSGRPKGQEPAPEAARKPHEAGRPWDGRAAPCLDEPLADRVRDGVGAVPQLQP
ncbi:BTAD domain-containing putative transcriptional regulator [Motilibacter deserti]|uniref:AAA family ATPase n=1 Tax=Motilibacter deserti TaxID=2714956 RepID=A0ABX0GVT7_9ACTN|nr:AAA family ATPase [Motilibacter deserti]NHC13816.1 AAA family ATPase [Motilibacter deserti]